MRTEELKFDTTITTIERHILDAQSKRPGATGELTSVLYDLALAGKLIARKTTRAGLADVIGSTGDENVQGETVQKLDVYAHRTIVRVNDHTGRLAVMGSEESDGLIKIPKEFATGKYALLFDPLDGSSNIDFNVSVGTIFTVFKRRSKSGAGTMEDLLQMSGDVVAAGYIVYGSSTMMVYSTGDGVNGFTLDPGIGEFLLSHPNIRLPDTPKYYSANLSYFNRWSKGVQAFTNWLQGDVGDNPYDMSMRYIGSMVADVHRTLLSGGIFYYPADTKSPNGKLRLLYEIIPMSYLIEQAGGYASTGTVPISEVKPNDLHQRNPVFIGSRDLVEKAESFIQELG